MSLLQECIEINQEQVDALPVLEMLDESIKQLGLQKAGGIAPHRLVQGKAVRDMFKANPKLVTKAATLAINGLNQHNKYLRKTIKLHARSAYDRKMMTSIVDALKGTGQFKVWRIKYEGGGKTWVMKYRK